MLTVQICSEDSVTWESMFSAQCVPAWTSCMRERKKMLQEAIHAAWRLGSRSSTDFVRMVIGNKGGCCMYNTRRQGQGRGSRAVPLFLLKHAVLLAQELQLWCRSVFRSHNPPGLHEEDGSWDGMCLWSKFKMNLDISTEKLHILELWFAFLFLLQWSIHRDASAISTSLADDSVNLRQQRS